MKCSRRGAEKKGAGREGQGGGFKVGGELNSWGRNLHGEVSGCVHASVY